MAQDQTQPQDDFSEIALAKFLTAFPELGNLIVTFNDLSHELSEDNGMQVGIFILRSGAEVFYVPCVSKDSNVYPVDSVFFASKSRFFPLTKKTIGLILTANNDQGRGVKIPSNVVANPDLTSLVNPPRTGKFVQASASHLSDFMAALPDNVKQFTMEKLAQEKSVYENLHKMFNIKDIFAALHIEPKGMAAKVSESPVSIVTGAIDNPSATETSDIISKGYSIRGTPANTRIAVSGVNSNNTRFTNVVELDGGFDHELVLNNGTSRDAFIPKNLQLGDFHARGRSTAAIFTNGDYAISDSFVAKGDTLNRTAVLDSLFDIIPPILPKDVEVGDTFAIIDVNANLVGVFQANRVTLSNLGVEIASTVKSGALPLGHIIINAYRNFGTSPVLNGKELFIRYNSLAIKLKDNITFDMERSVNHASSRNEISQISLLGEELNLGYDGIEFIIDGKAVGQEKHAMERLVVKESIDPELAASFIKQAKERKFTKIYLSKKAADGNLNPDGDIPAFGQKATPVGKTGLNGSFIPNTQQAASTGDAQTTEATIISELLQTPDTYEMIEQYLPDIEQAVDRLGRILLLSRVHVTQLSEDNDTESLMSFLANLKNVYRMLGDNLIKLQELVALKPNEKK